MAVTEYLTSSLVVDSQIKFAARIMS